MRRIIKSTRHRKRNRDLTTSMKTEQSGKTIYIIIPVLDEVTRIHATLKHFIEMSKQYGLELTPVVVTTEAETEYQRQKYQEFERDKLQLSDDDAWHTLTKDLWHAEVPLREATTPEERWTQLLNATNTVTYIKSLSTTMSILHLHYPHSEGVMAHQVNYAINRLCEQFGEDSIFALYNADSAPDARTFMWLRGQPEFHDPMFIYQQYGQYSKNLGQLLETTWRSRLACYCLIAASAWQLRWALGFEYFNAIRQRSLSGKANTSMNYCIGHGLFFTGGVFRKFYGFSEVFPNEDAIFGLQATYHNIPIRPIPYFESCESPIKVRSLYIQKSTWHNGPRHAFRYYRHLTENQYKKWPLLYYSALLFEHSVRWIVMPVILMLASIACLSGHLSVLALLSFYLFYLCIPSLVAYRSLRDQQMPATRAMIIPILLGSYPMFVLHGLSAIRSIFRELMNGRKEKTPV